MLKHMDKSSYKYTCMHSGCGAKFPRLDTLNRHEKIHSDTKPYTCNVCRAAFTDPSYLTKHTKKLHMGERQYECSYRGCDKFFSNEDALLDHECLHSGDRAHVCPYEGCGKAYIRKSSLTRHKKDVHE